MAQENFDVQAWQQQGKQALETLNEERNQLITEIEALDKQIEEVENALGLTKEKPKRIRIRPVIMAQVEANKGKWVETDVVIAAVHENIGGVDVTSIQTAISRAVRDIEGLEEKDGKLRLE